MRYLVFLVALSGCGPGVVVTPAFHDPETVALVTEFENYYGVSTSNVTIVLGATEPIAKNSVGDCQEPQSLVTLDSEYWAQASPLTRRALLFHELGHCALGRDHKVGTLSDECPNSIMNPYVLEDDCFDAHFDALIEELGSERNNK